MFSFIRSALLLVALSPGAFAKDWPRWLGPNGDLSWREEGLLQSLPKEGPKVLWRVPVKNGYAGPAVAGGKVFLNDYEVATGVVDANYNGRTALTGKERLLCLDEKDGQQLWAYQYDCPINLSYPNGPRCTPFVDGDLVYSLGAEGHLACLRVKDGSLVWSKELKKDYGVESPFWGYTHHPLVHGDLLFAMPGGKGTTAVAFEKKTGKEVWRALNAKEPGYAPPVIINHGGVEQLIVWHSEAVNSLDPKTGKVHWTVPFAAQYAMSIHAPCVKGDYLFLGAMVKKSIMLKLQPGAKKPEIAWEGTPREGFSPKNGTPVMLGDYFYGCDMDGELRFCETATGKRLWTSQKPLNGKSPNSGSLFFAYSGELQYIFTDEGNLILAKVSPKGYEEISRAKVLEPSTPSIGREVVWSHPAFAQKSMFARNDKELIRVSPAAD